MGNKINVSELLKNCPQGMELDCVMYEDVYFDHVDELNIIHCYIQNEGFKTSITFNQHGTPHSDVKSKCVIFPKGKTTWEGFQRPFKDGDVIYNRLQKKICIYYLCEDEVPRIKGCRYNESNPRLQFEKLKYTIPIAIQDYRLATGEEKIKLFKAITDNGYRWNSETKTLEKLLKFKDGDVVVDDSGALFIYKQIHPLYNKPYADFYCGLTSELRSFVIKAGELQRCGEISSLRYATEEEKVKLFQTIKDNGYRWNEKDKTLEKLIKPIFKKGDKVRVKKGFPEPRIARIIEDVCDTFYTLVSVGKIDFTDQNNWELVPDKFDISKLKPFDEVLVRDFDSEVWEIDFFSKLLDGKHFKCHGSSYVQCIPYKGNEHLHNTTNTCHPFYKTWEK